MPVPTARKVVLVTGSNRGVGLALVERFASQLNTVVYAGVRSTEPTNLSTGLQSLLRKLPETVKAVKLVSADEEGNKAAADLIKKEQGHVDVIIANAAVAYDSTAVATVPVATFIDHFNVNTLGPLVLYQSFASLLEVHSGSKFIVISTTVSSMTTTGAFPFIVAPYSTSKAAVNMLTRVIHAQSEAAGLVTFPLHPGAVTTEMSMGVKDSVGADTWDLIQVSMITPETSAKEIVKVVDGATRESHGGRFTSYDGSELEW